MPECSGATAEGGRGTVFEKPEESVTDVPVQRSAEARLGALSPEKRALLEKRLLARAAKTKPGPPPITRRTTTGPARLSPVQELLWLVTELSPEDSFVYNSAGATKLVGELDVAALQQALSLIVRRHEALRTTFRSADGVPVQEVHDVDGVALRHEDLSGLDETARERALTDVINREIRWPFVLSEPLLFRATLVSLGERENVLVTVAHHIVWDGWSKGIFFRELATAYSAYAEGREPVLPEVRLGYTDFAEWQRAWLESGEQERQLAYWRAQLAGVPPVLTLPTDRPRPPVQSHRGQRLSHWFDEELTRRIHELARARGVTLFMVLLAALDVVLHRYSGQGDIVVGTPIAGRSRVELEDLIGYFTNTVALRVQLGDDPTFAEVLNRARTASLDAYAHQDVSFKQVVQEVAPARDLSHSPLFQVLFVLQNATGARMELPGLSLERIEHRPGSAKFDLTIGMGEHDGRLHASIEYTTDLFERSTAARLAVHFEQVLRAAVADADIPISSIPLLTDEERDRQLVEWNSTDLPGADTPVHEQIAALADIDGDAPAIEAPDANLSRGQLRARARGVALALASAGIGKGDIVAVATPRSAAFVAAILGALGAGAAYVPLDPDYPADRLRFMLEDAGVKAVLTTTSTRSLLASLAPHDVPVLDVDELAPAEQGHDVRVSGDDLAYVMYTSGSTGAPKGVMVRHANLSAHVLASRTDYSLGENDRMLQFASPSFDISVEEIYCSLAAGATLVVRPDDVPIAGAEWLSWLESAAVTVADLPTAYWHEWVRELRVRGALPPASLRLVIVGGEKALPAVYAEWRALVGDRVRWVNTYGPTEATVVATSYWPTPERADADADEIPIGRPVANVRAYVLDRHRQPVPVGVIGELYIGGAGVAAGYLGRPELTAERFIDSPFVAGERLYRTGDLARQLADGTLIFAGRADHQVKVRGYRVEPGEIERVLTQHPLVAEAVVIPRTDTGGTVMLCAYAARVDGQDVAVEAVRAYLHDHLPSYMVPSSLVLLERLPLNTNGKVDTDALPEPHVVEQEIVAPRTRTERELHAIWCEVLGHDVASVHDNFFDLGGHSLLAVRMFAVVETQLGARLPLASIVARPTIAELAELLEGEQGGDDRFSPLVKLRDGRARVPLVVVHGVTGDVFAYRKLISYLDDGQQVYGFESPAVHPGQQVRHRLQDMARDYVRDLVDMQPHGPYRLVGICFGGVLAYEMAQQLTAQGREVDLLVVMNAVPFGFLRPGAQRTRQRVPARTRVARLRRRYHRTMWWRQAGPYVRDGRPLPEHLREVITLHHVATSLYRSAPYSGDVVSLVTDETIPDPATDRRLDWQYLARSMRVERVAGRGVTRVRFLSSDHVADAARVIQRLIDERDDA